jgi:hypothetical protein
MSAGGVDMQQLVSKTVSYLKALDEPARYQELNRLRMEQPQVYQLVTQAMASEGGSDPSANKPLPEQRAPTRGPGTALV